MYQNILKKLYKLFFMRNAFIKFMVIHLKIKALLQIKDMASVKSVLYFVKLSKVGKWNHCFTLHYPYTGWFGQIITFMPKTGPDPKAEFNRVAARFRSVEGHWLSSQRSLDRSGWFGGYAFSRIVQIQKRENTIGGSKNASLSKEAY